MSSATDPVAAYRAASRFASGVTVITTRNGANFYGLTATSFISLSLNPLLVSVSINSRSPLLVELGECGVFAVNVLASNQQHVSRYFATSGRGRSAGGFEGIETHAESTGAPVLTGALSWFDCRVHQLLDGGDHVIVVGEVATAGGNQGDPLLYFSGDYRELDSAQPTEIEQIADALSVQLHMQKISPADLFAAQLALEPVAAGLAASSRSPQQLQELQDLVRLAAGHVDDPASFAPLALRFHTQLGMLSNNPAIAASVQALAHARESIYEPATTDVRARLSTRAHQAIVEAIATGDAPEAQRLMAAHVDTVSEAFIG